MEKQKPKVAIAMSGGVDSSVAAKLLLDQGYEVVGFMMKLWSEDTEIPGRENACCDIRGVEDARRVAAKLGIPFYLVDAREIFKKSVVDYFIEEYKNLRTPNPCVVCNERIKFGWLLEFVKKSGCDFLATGHYARIQKKDGEYRLLKAKDENKDQTYFLYGLNQKQLSKIIFPVGEYTKLEVRELAKKWGLPVHEKPESQEICFIHDKDYREFLLRHIPEEYFKKGNIVDTEGNVLGKHEGLINYTIGQRKGIEQIGNGSKNKEPMYVVGYNVETNELVVGPDRQVYKKEMTVRQWSWISTKNSTHGPLKVKIRYRHQAVDCRVEDNNVIFDEPQRAITPGQSAVIYSGEEVLGGGIIS